MLIRQHRLHANGDASGQRQPRGVTYPLACCPVDSVTTIHVWAFARNYDLAPERDADYATVSQRVRDQDKPVIESQRPALVPPLSAGISLAMAPADAPLIEYLRWLEELNLTVTPDS